MRAAKIYMNKILAGILSEKDDGSYTFRYDDDYFSNPDYSSVSLTLPKMQQEYCSKTIFPFFYNMLSEGANKRVQCRIFKIDEEDAFGHLMATAHTDVIGAVTVKKMEI
jgi:serine/threonine-protein kinase HipA